MNMERKTRSADPALFNLIHFVPQKKHRQASTVSNTLGVCSRHTGSGHDIKAFYEALVKEDPDKCTNHDSEKKRVHSGEPKRQSSHTSNHKGRVRKTVSHSTESEHVSSFTRQRKYFKLLRSAQDDDDETLCSLLDSELDVNYQDFYGWTALMCAAHGGHSSSVDVCLRHRADRSLLNSAGQSAAVLAKVAGHLELEATILEFGKGNIFRTHSDDPRPSSRFMCETCKQEFSLTEKTSHLSSTVHLFSLGRRAVGPSFQLPETNRGFQILKRTGWDSNSGLGPEGQGQKFPVKTVLKLDRAGLGASSKKHAKITHFSARDSKAVEYVSHPTRASKKSVAKTAKMIIKAKAKKEKKIERALREEFADRY